MIISLLRPFPVFFPSTIEPAGSVHSIGSPRGKQLVAEGIAVEYHGQPSPSFSTPNYQQQPPPSPLLITPPKRDNSAAKNALVAIANGKDIAHSFAPPKDRTDKISRKARAAAALRRIVVSRKPGTPGKRSAAQALRAAISQSARTI